MLLCGTWSNRSEVIIRDMSGMSEMYKYMDYMRDTLQGGWEVKFKGPMV